MLLCDVSGSVAGFSNFTLLLVNALREQFSRVRVFAFIDTTDEVTRFFERTPTSDRRCSGWSARRTLITYDGHSDYGNAFGVFAEKFRTGVTSRSSLLILGDARNNYRDPNLANPRTAGRGGQARTLAQSRAQGAVGSRRLGCQGVQRGHQHARVPLGQQLAAVVVGLLPV